MIRTLNGLGVAVLLAAGLGWSAQQVEATTKVQAAPAHKAKAATSHTITGCLQKGEAANTFKLTDVEGKGPKTVELVGVPANLDLNAHVGHKVAITGTTVRAKQAERMEPHEKGESKAERTAEQKAEAGEHHMRVHSLKMVSTTCP